MDFLDKRLGEYATAHVYGETKEERDKAYRMMQRHYPGFEGPDQTINFYASTLIEMHKQDKKNKEDENGATFGSELS